MSGGKPVEVAIINLASEATRWSENQMGESASRESSLGRYSSFRGNRTCSEGQHVRRFPGRPSTLDSGRVGRG